MVANALCNHSKGSGFQLYDYGLRWYHPGQGRFINRDPIGEAGGLNLYAFVNNDPVNRFDVLGLRDDGRELEELPTFYIHGHAGQFSNHFSNPAHPFSSYEQYIQELIEMYEGMEGIDDNSGSAAEGKAQGEDLSHLPGCSELRKQFADGTYRPTVTAESFIPDPRVGPFHGDGREFLDSPSTTGVGTSRISVTSTYESVFERLPSGSGSEFRPVRTTREVGVTILDLGFAEFRRTGTADVSTFNASMGNRVYMNVAYSGSNPWVPGASPIRMDAGLVLDFSTGQLSGSVNRSSFPAAQIFFDGQSVYRGDASDRGAIRGLRVDAQGKINGVPICDPSR